jgi:hypothetical protein
MYRKRSSYRHCSWERLDDDEHTNESQTSQGFRFFGMRVSQCYGIAAVLFKSHPKKWRDLRTGTIPTWVHFM